MTTSSLTGVVPPVATPLTRDRALDVRSLDRLVDHLLDGGVHGLFVNGSTSEVAFSTDERRVEVLTATLARASGRVPVICGVIDTQTARVVEHVRAAEEAGAAGVVVTAPFYAAVTDREVGRHLERVAASTSLPVWAYDIPACVHTKLATDLLVDLGRDGVLTGVKDSSGDDVAFRRLLLANRDAGSPLTVLTGHEVVVDGAYLAGADGVVPGLGNVDPAGYVRLHDACVAGDWQTARSEQDRLARLMEVATVARAGGWARGVGGFKTALRLLGVIDDDQLPEPFEGFDAHDTDAVRRVLVGAGLLVEDAA